MIDGSTPLVPKLSRIAIGLTPKAFAFSSVITNIAAAPSLIPDALPAVTEPSFLNAGRNLPNLSAVVPWRIPSSCETIIGSPLR